MRLGLHALGIGTGARREVIDAVAVAAEDAGFSTLWVGEHVVMVDRSASRYPYAPDGRIAVPADADWLDPMIALSFAAATTSTIRLATGVLLVPEHNPVTLAKQAATLCEIGSRDPSELEIAIALDHLPGPQDHDDLAQLGINELVLVAAPPADPAQANDWVKALRSNTQ